MSRMAGWLRRGAPRRLGALALAARPMAIRTTHALRSTDVTGAVIAVADRIEAAFIAARRGLRRAGVRPGFGVAGGLAWRGLAALTGVALAATLATALSTGDAGPHPASLDESKAGEPAIRDVRQQPRALTPGGDGWVAIARPIAMFGLDSPMLEKRPLAYSARRSQDDASREDMLAFGDFAEDAPHLTLRLLVSRVEDELSQPFMIALVRLAAMRGMSVQRSGAPTLVETRFGPVETADATFSDGVGSRACIGFRHAGGETPLTISGWWCGSPQRPADRQQLVCLLDRLDLLNAGDDRALRAAFSRSELNRRPGCSPPHLSAAGRKASWLDADGRQPTLRTATRR